MNHIKNFLNEKNTYGVDITFFVDEKNTYVKGKSDGEETEVDLKTIFFNLDRMGYIKQYNKPTEINLVDGGDDDDGVPIFDLYFYDSEGNLDHDFTPVLSVTNELLNELFLTHF